MIDPSDRVLMVKLAWPGWTGWVLPGGGIEEGESTHEALRREIDEETGVRDAFIGPPVLRRRQEIQGMMEGWDGQDEVVFLVPCRSAELAPAMTEEELRAEHVVDHHWWTLDELRATSEIVRPEGLVALVERTLEFGAPDEVPVLQVKTN